MRQAIAILLVAMTTINATAQVMVAPGLETAKSPAPKHEPAPKTLTVYAAQQPDPLLRYPLWPPAQHRRDVNAMPMVIRSLVLVMSSTPKARQEFNEKILQWQGLSPKELPRDEVRQFLGRYDAAFQELKRAENAMQIRYELQLEDLSTAELIATMLPELQESRSLARLLHLRGRLAIAEQRWDDLATDCRVGFRLADAVAHSTDFLVGRLIGFAIAGVMFDLIEDAIQQPDCPSFYWSLAVLPAEQLFEIRAAIEYDTVILDRLFRRALSLPDEAIDESFARDELRRLVSAAIEFNEGQKPDAPSLSLQTGAYVVAFAPESRELLDQTPEWADRVKNLSAAEVVLRAAALKYSRIRDRFYAWSTLLPEHGDKFDIERLVARPSDARFDLVANLVALMMPAAHQGQQAGLRMKQTRNRLLTYEAIRLHAGQTGELPISIDRLEPVPAWPDYIAQSLFGYSRQSPNVATLTFVDPRRGNSNKTIRIVLTEVN